MSSVAPPSPSMLPTGSLLPPPPPPSLEQTPLFGPPPPPPPGGPPFRVEGIVDLPQAGAPVVQQASARIFVPRTRMCLERLLRPPVAPVMARFVHSVVAIAEHPVTLSTFQMLAVETFSHAQLKEKNNLGLLYLLCRFRHGQLEAGLAVSAVRARHTNVGRSGVPRGECGAGEEVVQPSSPTCGHRACARETR